MPKIAQIEKRGIIIPRGRKKSLYGRPTASNIAKKALNPAFSAFRDILPGFGLITKNILLKVTL